MPANFAKLTASVATDKRGLTRLLPHISRHVPAFFEKLPPCLVGIEACASSHHWSRELALSHSYGCCRSIRVSARCGKRRFSRLKSDFANTAFRTPIKTRSAF
jgi:transposase